MLHKSYVAIEMKFSVSRGCPRPTQYLEYTADRNDWTDGEIEQSAASHENIL